MGVKPGTKRGPYKKTDRPVRKKSRSYLPCPGLNDDGTRCNNLTFRFGYCWTHQGLLPGWKQIPTLYCDLCKEDIHKDKRSEVKSLCSSCILKMGQKCKNCNRGTLDFDTGLCKLHKNGTGGKVQKRNFCSHVVQVKCNRLSSNRYMKCSRHGGKDCKGKDVARCTTLIQKHCREHVPLIKEVDLHRVPDTTKCFLHGGIPLCYICVKPACVGFEGMCEDHGGRVCPLCRGPVYKKHRDSLCHKCHHKAKLKRLKELYEKKKAQRNSKDSPQGISGGSQ